MRALLWILFSLMSLGASSDATTLILRAKIDGGINMVVADYINDAIETARTEKAKLLVIELDTPGGLLEATRQIAKVMLASPVPVVVYVTPEGARAGSAGVFLTLAAHVAVMAPSTNIGAAHPVSMFGGDVEGDMAKKVENDAAAWARALAQKNGRNPEWAQKAVMESASITADEALKQNIIDFIAPDFQSLLKQLEGREVTVLGESVSLSTSGAQTKNVEMNAKQQLVNWLSNPNLLYIIMLLGFFFLFLEYILPGTFLPGLLGVMCLVLVFGIQLLPVNGLGVLLIFGAVALMIAEIFVVSFGLLTIGALILLITGSYLLFDVEGSTLQINPIVIWTFALSLVAIFAALGLLVVRAKRQGGTSGTDAMVGTQAEVTVAISPSEPGLVRIQGSYWRAESNDIVTIGEKVRIVRVVSTKVFVEKI